ncbi:MAG: hypothetical protein AAF821_27075 [Cyanobacteria bacterium P01_D01_bin.156]
MLIEPGDVGAIATAMIILLNPDIAQRLVNHSQSVISRYSWGHSAQMHLALYTKLI